MRICSLVMLAAAVAWPVTTAVAASGAGQTVAVVDNANASGQGGSRTLAAGSEIFVGDTVATDATGEAQIRFGDGTRMVVGAGSSLVIDEALFRGAASENKFAVRALGGAFRFISGDSGDKDYKIRTPSATIGVRGTAFDIIVFTDANGKTHTKVLALEDEVTLCGEDEQGNQTECETVATPCAILQTEDEDDDQVEAIPYSEGKSDKIHEEFPYAKSQDKLEDDFRVAGVPCVLGGLAAAGLTGSSLATVGGIAAVAVAIGVIIAVSGKNNSNNNTNN
ncbi:MAG TPA: FecR domain-containing protein [Thermohalobaculum sp.]|nr:FecR domain-containing protein [Thermohalobaculum sp.]